MATIVRDFGINFEELNHAYNNGFVEDVHEIKFNYEIRDCSIKHKNSLNSSKIKINKWFGEIKFDFNDLQKLYPNKTNMFVCSHYLESCMIDKVLMYDENGNYIFTTTEEKIEKVFFILNFIF